MTVDTPVSDAELVVAARQGDATAYSLLYHRHVVAARRLARVLVRDPADAEDLVADAFAKVLAALRRGGGPKEAFRAYLLTSLRHVCYDRAKRDKKLLLTDDMNVIDHGETFEDPVVTRAERTYAARAFAKLPERWRMVLWHTEVEGESPAQVAPLLGLTPNGVSALAYRARERLKQIYLQEHLAESPVECHWTADRLGAYVRGGLASRDSGKVQRHLSTCAGCTLRQVEVLQINKQIPVVLGPVVLGGATAGYLGISATGTKVAVGGWIAAHWFALVTWVRRIGTRNLAIGGGATAVVAAAIVLILVSGEQKPPPDVALAPTVPSQVPMPPAVILPPPPVVPPPPTEAAPEPRPTPTPPAPAPAPVPVPGDFEVAPALDGGGLSAGGPGELPVTVRDPRPAGTVARSINLDIKDVTEPRPESAPAFGPTEQVAAEPRTLGRAEPAAHEPRGFGPVDPGDEDPRAESTPAPAPTTPVTLTLDLPPQFTLTAPDAGDGWTCAKTDTVTCTRPPLAPGAASTARVRLTVTADASGFYPVRLAVTGLGRRGSADVRVAVAPTGTRVGYAISGTPAAVALAGNTLLSCLPRPWCRSTAEDNQDAVMAPYRAPGAPAGPEQGASGARLAIPAGATVRWAGLYWATSNRAAPGSVTLNGTRVTADGRSTVTNGYRTLGQAYAEVTDLVRGGEVWVSASGLPTGSGEYAGWGLAVVYEQAGPPRDVAVYQGPAALRHNQVSVRVAGSAVRADLLLWDGDAPLEEDELTLGSTTLATNVGHSRSTTALEGDDWRTYGVDAARYEARLAGESVLTVRPGEDPMELGLLAVTVDR
ncbi:sigma-70 family RNA polymerase sigma factor [Longispora sp. K20-0274]|uniref:sigma-70 family RNA polymerase sigma factor n=1 Tax=Longispora sp. K20-0274 TaxID=3088255 RepID=UPI0039996A12